MERDWFRMKYGRTGPDRRRGPSRELTRGTVAEKKPEIDPKLVEDMRTSMYRLFRTIESYYYKLSEAIPYLEAHRREIHEAFEMNDPTTTGYLLDGLNRVIKMQLEPMGYEGRDEIQRRDIQRQVAIDRLSDHLGIVAVRYAGNPELSRHVAESIGLVLNFTHNWVQRDNAKVSLEGNMHALCRNDGAAVALTKYAFERHLPQIAELVAKHNYKLKSPEKVFQSWNRDTSEKTRESVKRNIEMMSMLEQKRPGIVQFLNTGFGIENFARYPLEVLIRQFDEFDDVEKPYGISIFSKWDHNGALDGTSVFYNIDGQIPKYALKIFECGSKQDVARALVKLKKKYNPKDEEAHKASFVLIGGHSDGKKIWLGNDQVEKTRDVIVPTDMLGNGVKRTSEFLQEKASIILFSCSTGSETGIAKKMSESLGRKVIAPDTVATVGGVDVKEVAPGELTFNVHYGAQASEQTFAPGVPQQKPSAAK